jgi:hypothetical protein
VVTLEDVEEVENEETEEEEETPAKKGNAIEVTAPVVPASALVCAAVCPEEGEFQRG